MTLAELKEMLRKERPDYANVIEQITQAALSDKRFVDFSRDDMPDVVHERIVEDGYKIIYIKYSDRCYRVYGWAGDVTEHS